MGKQYVMTGSFLDGFKVSFTKKECILAEKHYPLGYFAVEFLEVDRTLLRKLERLVPIFQEEFTAFLSARDPSSAALAQQALNAVWDVLLQLPVYRHLEQHSGGVRRLLREMKELPDIVDAMLTPGTDRSEVLHEWLRRLTTLPGSIWDFILSTEKMLMQYYGDLQNDLTLPEHHPYAKPSWFGFPITCKQAGQRNRVVRALEDAGIQTRMLFAGNLIRHPCFDGLRKTENSFRVAGSLTQTDRVVTDTFWVGVYPGLTDENIQYMVDHIEKAVRT